MENAGEFTLQVEQVSGFDFRIRFDKESVVTQSVREGIDVHVNVTRA